MIRKMNRTTIFIAATVAALALPAAASANCGTMQGSYAVTCEQGVQVFRHQALSSIPQGLSAQQTQLEAEKIRAQTARAQIASNDRIAAANTKLRERELALDDFNARTDSRFLRNSDNFRNNNFGSGFGNNSFFGNSGIRGGFRSSTRPRSAFRQKGH